MTKNLNKCEIIGSSAFGTFVFGFGMIGGLRRVKEKEFAPNFWKPSGKIIEKAT